MQRFLNELGNVELLAACGWQGEGIASDAVFVAEELVSSWNALYSYMYCVHVVEKCVDSKCHLTHQP